MPAAVATQPPRSATFEGRRQLHSEMELDMDLDIGWCLACSKRTRDQRSPYCSDACRKDDTQPNTPAADTTAITSPLPAKFLSLPPRPSESSRHPSERHPLRNGADNCSPHRPEPAPVQGKPHQTSDPLGESKNHRQRDRRAFSFPASDGTSIAEHPALPFTRKTKPVNSTSRSFKAAYTSADLTRGGYTNNLAGFDSPFESTSDSDNANDKDDAVKRSPAMSLSALHPPPPVPITRGYPNATIPSLSQATSISSPHHTARPSLEARAATSPIARMGSSSRSREDIISWARGVDSGVSLNADGDDVAAGSHQTLRGRPRRPRPNALSGLAPPSTESLDDPVERTGSTPTSASRALSALSFTPVVNAIRRVSVGVRATPETSTLGLTMPAPAEVSIVDVVVGTHAQEQEHHVMGEGDTPTLSTVSMSEAVDPSNTDFGETIDTVTDDFSVISSDRRGSYGQRYSGVQAAVPQQPQAQAASPVVLQRKSTLPIRPIQTTASAFWNLSAYLRSLTPFAMSPAATPMTPTKDRVMTPTIPEASAVTHTTPDFKATVPVPTNNIFDTVDPLVDPAHDMVRSVPMDIVITGRAQALAEERQREREAAELLKVGRTPPTRIEASRSPSPDRQVVEEPPVVEDVEDTRRGRSRRREASPPPAAQDSSDDDARGRRRDRTHEGRERSWSAHRGRTSRSRTARTAVAV